MTSFSREIVRYNSYTQSKDKLYRIFQYGARLVLWYIQKVGSKSVLGSKLQKMEETVALSRKLFRMGNSTELIHKAMDSFKMPDTYQALLGVTTHSFKALWLILDHIIWFGKVEALQIQIKTWTVWASRAWLVSLLAATVINIHKINHVKAQIAKAGSRHGQSDHQHRNDKQLLKRDYHGAQMTFLKDFCDVFIPLSSLGYVSPGLGAFCGVVSSYVGFKLEWEKHVKPFKTHEH
ncbi:peroxisomal membrane protein 11A [Patella vulgata]|uniref:peroxisomal membrane protein 11A n=1 Tax=Patella vulgata TaxID=6465 RepID=UPI0021803C99|nr:peroxisomal membrane protein 11A [Patella vulgata]